MNPKHLKLINYLSAQRKATAKELAAFLDVSSRSIKTYVKEINEEQKGDLIVSSKDGYSLDKNLLKDLKEIKDVSDIPQNFTERMQYIIRILLMDKEEIDLYDVADEIYVSYQTLVNDVKRMNSIYQDDQIAFVIQKGILHIKGEEEAKRKLISKVLQEEANDAFLNVDTLSEIFEGYNFKELSDRLKKIYDEHGFYLNGLNYANLLLHIMIIIFRDEYHDTYSIFNEVNIENNDFLNEVITVIEDTLQVKISEESAKEIKVLILSNTVFPDQINTVSYNGIRNEVIDSLIDKIIFIGQDEYGIDLNNDMFKLPFTLHLANLCRRLEYGFSVSNPMTNEIKEKCPFIYDVAIRIAYELNNDLQTSLSQDEISFIALHIGGEIERQKEVNQKIPVILVCQDYHGMRDWLYMQIINNYGSRVFVEKIVDSLKEIEDRNKVIIALRPQNDIESYRHLILVSPFSKLPAMEITTMLNQVSRQTHIESFIANFDRFCKEELFFLNKETNDYHDLLQQMCQQLRNMKYVHSSFYEEVIERETASSTAYPGMAIPHSMKMDSYKSSICIALSEEGISWNDKIVHLVFLFALNKNDNRFFKDLVEMLILIFEEEENITLLSKCRSFSEFREKLLYICNNIIQ